MSDNAQLTPHERYKRAKALKSHDGISPVGAPAPEDKLPLLGGVALGYTERPVVGRLPVDAKARKALPVTTGVLDYFPGALVAVAEVSRVGNDQHNPGQPLHWDKSKSTDHADSLVRHLLERGGLDDDGVRHSAKVAWRALALLQVELDHENGLAQ